jgi:hypothetical protein
MKDSMNIFFRFSAALIAATTAVAVFAETPEALNAPRLEPEKIAKLIGAARVSEDLKKMRVFVRLTDVTTDDLIAARPALEAMLNDACVQNEIDSDACSQIAQEGVAFIKSNRSGSALLKSLQLFDEQRELILAKKASLASATPSDSTELLEEQAADNPDNGQQ